MSTAGWLHEPRQGSRRDGTMAQTNRLHHDLEVAQRATLGLTTALVLAGFIVLALGAAVYDIGDWLGLW